MVEAATGHLHLHHHPALAPTSSAPPMDTASGRPLSAGPPQQQQQQLFFPASSTAAAAAPAELKLSPVLDIPPAMMPQELSKLPPQFVQHHNQQQQQQQQQQHTPLRKAAAVTSTANGSSSTNGVTGHKTTLTGLGFTIDNSANNNNNNKVLVPTEGGKVLMQQQQTAGGYPPPSHGSYLDPSQWTVVDETQDHPGRRKDSGFLQPIKHLSGKTNFNLS